MNKKQFAILLACSIIASIVFVNCSDRATSNDNLQTTLKIATGAVPAGLETFTLTVTAEDFSEQITTSLSYDGQYLTGEITVPAGTSRTFTLEAFDGNGTLIYRGSTTMDLVRGEPIMIDVNLSVTHPTIRMTPRYQEVFMDSSFTINVEAYQMLDLAGLEFEFDFTNASGTIITPRITAGSSIDSTIGFSWGTTESYTSVWISFIDTSATGSFSDDSGFAHLATLEFDTHSDTNLDFDTVQFEFPRVGAIDAAGDSIDNIFSDQATIILEKAPAR